MKIKVYNYALWRDEASGAYFTKINGTPVEISKEIYHELMNIMRLANCRDLSEITADKLILLNKR